MKNNKKKELLMLARDKGLTSEVGVYKIMFIKDRYSGGCFNGGKDGKGDDVVLLLGHRYESKWAKEMISSDSLTAASFWYRQKCLPYSERCAFSPKEFERYVNNESEANDIGEGLVNVKIFKEVQLTKQEKDNFLFLNGISPDGQPLSTATSSRLDGKFEGDNFIIS